MGKAGRFACIFIPLVLTVASLICILLVGVGGTNKNSSTLNKLYFFEANTTGFNINAGLNLVPGTKVDDSILSQGGDAAKQAVNLKDIYTVSLWNYCDGSNDANGGYKVEECSARQTAFWFNPLQVWGLENSPLEQAFPKELTDALNTYHKVSTWMFWAYIVAFVATVIELVVGFFAVFSRWGSFVTTIVSGVAFLFTVAASITSTALFAALAGSFNSYLKDYNIHGSMGRSMYVTTWLAVAFSAGASLFWLISTCCVSGRDKHRNDAYKGGKQAEYTPYTYERVASPYAPGHQTSGHTAGPANLPMRPAHHQSAYEPFRHEQV